MSSDPDLLAYLHKRDEQSAKERQEIFTTLTRIEANQRQFEKSLTELEIEVSTHLKESSDLLAKVTNMISTVSDLKKTVYGNGREGLETRTTRLEQDTTTKKQSHYILAQWVVIAVTIMALIAERVG